MPKKSEYVRGYFLAIVERDVNHDSRRFRAELWWNPYDGHVCASTRWVDSQAKAKRDGAKFLTVPLRKESR